MSKEKNKYAFDEMNEKNPGYLAAFIDKALTYIEYDIDDYWVSDMVDELLPKYPDNIDLLKISATLGGLAGMDCTTVDAYQKICAAEPTFEHKFLFANAMISSVEFNVYMIDLAIEDNKDIPQDIDILASRQLIQQSLKIVEELSKEPEYNSWHDRIEEDIVKKANIFQSKLPVK